MVTGCLSLRCVADLSFNRISKVEGLDALVQLTDLSLLQNDIKYIAHLDRCTALECLSLGNNKISDVNNVRFATYHVRVVWRLLTGAAIPVCVFAIHKITPLLSAYCNAAYVPETLPSAESAFT